jgi:hypothetical protein
MSYVLRFTQEKTYNVWGCRWCDEYATTSSIEEAETFKSIREALEWAERFKVSEQTEVFEFVLRKVESR